MTDTLRIDIRMSDVAELAAGDTFQTGEEVFEVRAEPIRDAEHMIWSAEARVL